MNKAKLESSDRLKKVLACLKVRPMTTIEIIKFAQVCAVNSIISELRQNDIDIKCECIGRGRFLYSLK